MLALQTVATAPLSSDFPDWLLYLAAIVAVAAAYLYLTHHTLTARPQHVPTTTAATAPTTSASATDTVNDTAALPAMSLAELAEYNGTDASKPLYLGCGGLVFDMSTGRSFYGPGAPYGVFAGRDASRGLARMEIEYKGANVSDLTGEQRVTLDEWTSKYKSKYRIVARIVDDSEPNSGTPTATSR